MSDPAHRLALSLAAQVTGKGTVPIPRRPTGNGDGSFPRREPIARPEPIAGRELRGATGNGDGSFPRREPLARPELPDADGLLLHHTCPTCASTEHGVPYTVASGRRVALSLARAAGAVAAAAALDAAVGIDLETVDAAGFDGFAAVALHPDEPQPRDARAASRLWVRKEAVLKALGQGLRIDPRTLLLSAGNQTADQPGDQPRVLAWPDPRPPSVLDLRDLDAPAGYVAALAVIGGRGAEYTHAVIRLDTSEVV